MTKITLDRETFKALASDTRLDILKTLDGKHLGLNELVSASNLNKATLHEHLTKLHEAGLIKRTEREGHKWVYYQLTWKGSCLLHPENTRIVVLFTATFVALSVGIMQLILYLRETVVNRVMANSEWLKDAGGEPPLLGQSPDTVQALSQTPPYLYLAIVCFVLFTICCCVAVWRYRVNRTQKL